MNTILIAILATPVIEIFLMIKIGQNIGAINTILLVILTAVIGIYFARLQGLLALKSAFRNVYENKTPINDLLAGASIAIGAVFLIIPGFMTDFIGFVLLIPFTRKLIINHLLKNYQPKNQHNDIVDGEIVEEKEIIEKKKEKDEL